MIFIAHAVGMSNRDLQTEVDAFVGPLAAAVIVVLERRPEFRALVRALLVSERQFPSKREESRLYSISDLGRIYGVGRTIVLSDIRSGRLQATERRCRGGKTGNFIAVEEAERVYARCAG